MQARARYDDVVARGGARSWPSALARRARRACARLLVDPGIGFAKTAAHNLRAAGAPAASCARSAARSWSAPRASRSSGKLTGRAVDARELATAAANAAAVAARGQHRARARRRGASAMPSPSRCESRRACDGRPAPRCSTGLTVREALIAAADIIIVYYVDLSRAAAHQGHARGADADRPGARRRRLLRRQAARADDADLAARQPHQLLRSSSSSSSSSTTSAAA